MVFAAMPRAASTFAASPLLASGAPHSYARIAWVRFSLPGSPDQLLHLVAVATDRTALTASHSLGETTATRLPLFTTSAVGNRFLSTWPTEMRVEPMVGGRTMRACSIPGNTTSQLHC